VSRRDDLIEHIRESYALVREYEEKITLSDDPREIKRSQRAVEQQKALIQGWLAELQQIGGALPADLVAAGPAAGPASPASPPAGGNRYEIHIQEAHGLAIGDGARVEMAGAAAPTPGGGDAYARYEVGLTRLLARLEARHPRRSEALVYEQRLRENLAQARFYGDTETRRAERAEIVSRLNVLAQDALGISFNELLAG